jgi:hypothetical protein
MVAMAEVESPGFAERFVKHPGRCLIKRLGAEVCIIGGGKRLGSIPKFWMGGQQGSRTQNNHLTILSERSKC